MRKIQKPLAVLLFAMLVVISCKRESLPDKPNSPKEESKTSAPSQVIYRKSPAEIAAAKERWLTSARASLRGEIAARGGCGTHVKNHLELASITGSCSGSSWDVEYYIWSLDWVGSGYATAPVSASFTDLSSNPITATLLSSNATLDDPGCTNWWVDGYCLMLREYVYEMSLSHGSTPWPSVMGNYTLNLLSGFLPSCTPLAVTGDLKGSLTSTEISALPASITVSTPSSSSLFIATECALVCYPPTAICPSGGTFSYRPAGSSGAYTNLTLNAAGGLFFSIPSGNYEYTCTLVYSGGAYSSLPATGLFSL